MEHWHAVQVVATRTNETGQTTESYAHGAGNWRAREGLMRHMVTKHNEDARIEMRSEQEEDG